ncbi:alanyl-tRNA editing protein [Ornithinibacillus massiliensis]|uniref:Alanyl-tRNA editing protein n=1 Tax=Ornithinibacillus massiliensis TaxID=1944633 RepID=A0ABS5MDD7_9BACI|nr:alanyl-tRNA editing protein [Ornithinibacillus massiliensis]
MKTEKLYYQDPYLGRFTASILHKGKDEQGQFYVVLDQTAFYPTGGGQPHDTGTLDDIEVYNVVEIDGKIRHYLNGTLDKDQECVGEIDWERRLDHMQQHAGQHILSAAFEEEHGYKTVSFHLGKELCSIDLATDLLTKEEALAVENIANIIIIENRPIETRWVTKDELIHYRLRKKVSVSQNIRLVIIPDFDYNGCGGTHPNSTGQVGSIEILHWENHKKHTRLYFVCGKRVRHQLHEKHQVIQGLTAILSTPQEQLIEATKRVIEQTRELENTVKDLKLQLIDYEAASLMEKYTNQIGFRLIEQVFENRTMPEIQQLAKNITAKSTNTLVFFVNETIDKLQIVCACGSDVPMKMNQVLKQVLPRINGKGGGTDTIAQGGGEKLVTGKELMAELVKELD